MAGIPSRSPSHRARVPIAHTASEAGSYLLGATAHTLYGDGIRLDGAFPAADRAATCVDSESSALERDDADARTFAQVLDTRGGHVRAASPDPTDALRVRGGTRIQVKRAPTVVRARAGLRAMGDGDASAVRRRPRRWGNWLRKALALCSIGVAAVLLIQSPTASSRPDSREGVSQANARHATPAVSAHERTALMRAIEDIQVGDRIAGTNPLREQVDGFEPEPNTWRKLSFRMRRDDGLELWIDLLRPLAWIQTREIEAGRTTFLDLQEMGAVGEAEVTYVGPCPPVENGGGTVVTGKFIHESDGTDVVQLRLTGETEPIGVTRNHPYWSRDRAAFVRVDELRADELVDTPSGDRRVLSVEPVNYSGYLYNLETTEHVYRVGQPGVLAHNSCAQFYQLLGGHHIFSKSAFRGAAGYSMGKALSIPAKLLRNLNHQAMTNVQRAAYQLLAKTGKPLTLVREKNIAYRALVAGGMSPSSAKEAVSEAYQQLKNWKVRPTRIPYTGTPIP